MNHSISVYHQYSMNTSHIGFYFSSLKYQGQSNFVNNYHCCNAKKTLWRSKQVSQLEICTDIGQPCRSFCFMAPSVFSAVHSSHTSTRRCCTSSCSFSSFLSMWGARGCTDLIVRLSLLLTPFLLYYDKLQNYLPSHSANLNWMIWGKLNILVFLFMYTWYMEEVIVLTIKF